MTWIEKEAVGVRDAMEGREIGLDESSGKYSMMLRNGTCVLGIVMRQLIGKNGNQKMRYRGGEKLIKSS